MIFLNFGYSEIRTPTLEDADLFKRSVGDSSDIVNKELYSFLDKGLKCYEKIRNGTWHQSIERYMVSTDNQIILDSTQFS